MENAMIYVDNARIPFGRMRMSHLMADTSEELHDVARDLGLSRWIQKSGEPGEHLDVSMSKREEAIRLGAKAVRSRELVVLVQNRRIG